MRLKLGKDNLQKIDKKVINVLTQYDWPGNIRELQNTLERAVNFSQGSTLTLDDLPSDIKTTNTQKTISTTKSHFSMESYESEMIKNLLKLHGGNISRVADEMGVTRSTLYRKIYKYKLN